jgi:hypothetical protein
MKCGKQKNELLYSVCIQTDDKLAKYPEHSTDSEDCWCDPQVVFIDAETGNKVIVHRDFQ